MISLSLSINGRSWYRHSVYFKHALFGISDIDITYVGVDTYNVVKKYKLIKKFLPILGEMNCYREQDLKYLSLFHNPLELKRDPLLLERLTLENNRDREIDAIVYILRCYQADASNLKKYPLLRKRKWSFHLHAVENYLGVSINSDLFNFIEQITNEKLYLNHSSLKKPEICPHLWLQDHYHDNELNDLADQIQKKSTLVQNIFIGQLAFEFCGVISQIAMIEDKNSVKAHFNNIVKLIDQLDNVKAEKLVAGIKSFQNEGLLPQ